MTQVSKDWNALADEAASRRILQSFYMSPALQDGCRRCNRRSHVLAVRHQLILRRGFVQRLVVEKLADYGASGGGMWTAALSHAPHLKSLEFEGIRNQRWPIESLTDVTRAAACCCPLLVKLTLPIDLILSQAGPIDNDEEVHRGLCVCELSEAVRGGIAVWAQRGGLRHLRVPMHELMKTGEDATTYIDTILQYCPHIQIFNGYTPNIRPSDGAVGGEGFWRVDLPVWDRFCRGCEQLEVFEWRCVPFATRFFEVFGTYAKPKLRVLKFSVSCCWDWDQYFDTVGPAARAKLEMTGFGDTAVRPESALRATPNLESLHIEWDELLWQMDT